MAIQLSRLARFGQAGRSWRLVRPNLRLQRPKPLVLAIGSGKCAPPVDLRIVRRRSIDVSHTNLPGTALTNIDRDIVPLLLYTIIIKFPDCAYVVTDGRHLNKLE
jgi:hypothetical protein